MDLPLAPGTYHLDAMHTQIGFSVIHLGLTPVRGAFAEFSGQLSVGETPALSRLEVAVNLLSLQSTNAGREEHLQGDDFFSTNNYPEMSFCSTVIEGDGDQWSVTGDLTLRGLTNSVTLDARLTGRTIFPLDQKEHIGFVASGNLSRLAFGVGSMIPTMMLSDDIQIDLSVQLIPA
jgi:polyisoprenoid-binding protein YceI